MEARIFLTRSYGAVVDVICAADNSSTCLPFPSASSTATVTPCWTRRFAIVAMSARSGTFARVSVSGVSRLAAISGNAAFLAPPIGITPSSGTPPLIRILSIVSVPHAAYLRGPFRHGGCFYWSGARRSSRRLSLPVRRLGLCGFLRLLCTPLFLAPTQIFAQSLGQPLVARRPLGATSRYQVRSGFSHTLACANAIQLCVEPYPSDRLLLQDRIRIVSLTGCKTADRERRPQGEMNGDRLLPSPGYLNSIRHVNG